MQRKIIAGWVLILGSGTVWGQAALSAPQQPSLHPFPISALTALALQQDEVPPGYGLLTSTTLLAQAGLSKNPGYLTQRADLEDAIQMDAAASFLALYGPAHSVRLMLKGVFFREPQHARKYAEVQGSRQRLVMAFLKDTPGGIWLLFIACDPSQTYGQTELLLITQRLESYQNRLVLTPLFDQMNVHAK